jgi:hypothetical protein
MLYLLPLLIIGAVISAIVINHQQKQKFIFNPNEKKYNTDLTPMTDYPYKIQKDKDGLTYHNKTQSDYEFITRLFNLLSRNQTDYEYEPAEIQYTRDDIDFNRKEQLDVLIQPVINNINQITKNYLDIVFVNYENVVIRNIKNSNLKSWTINFTVWSKKLAQGYRIQTQLIIDFIELNSQQKKDMLTNRGQNVALQTTPEHPKYFLGYPNTNQYIPLPFNVIITGNQVISAQGVSYPVPMKFHELVVNTIEVFNSNLTLLAGEKATEKQTDGVGAGTLEFSTVSYHDTPYIEQYKARNKWIPLYTQPTDLEAYPCTPQPTQTWNSLGVPPKSAHPTKQCPGLRSSLDQQPLTASFDPSIFNNPRNNTEYQNMFSLFTNAGGQTRGF